MTLTGEVTYVNIRYGCSHPIQFGSSSRKIKMSCELGSSREQFYVLPEWRDYCFPHFLFLLAVRARVDPIERSFLPHALGSPTPKIVPELSSIFKQRCHYTRAHDGHAPQPFTRHRISKVSIAVESARMESSWRTWHIGFR